ncbi:uncharacterized protein [Bombus fervidus]|uniref:uncharacterized protein n=1 Tax=Bombus fervidus TaxID=203811 RepID=UPI003D18D919
MQPDVFEDLPVLAFVNLMNNKLTGINTAECTNWWNKQIWRINMATAKINDFGQSMTSLRRVAKIAELEVLLRFSLMSQSGAFRLARLRLRQKHRRASYDLTPYFRFKLL